MSFTKTLITSLLTAFTLLDGTLAGSLIIQNNLDSPLFASAARGGDRTSPGGEQTDSPAKMVAPGKNYATSGRFTAANDNVGISLKVSKSTDGSEPYQLQVTVSQGVTYYSISEIDSGGSFDGDNVVAWIPSEPDCPAARVEDGTQACDTTDSVFLYVS